MINKYTKEVVVNIFCDSYKMKQALEIAFVVGIILNIINQGDYVFHMAFDKINYYKFILTFFVPFCVSIYTAISISMELKVGDKAMASTHLICTVCDSKTHVNKNEVIQECPKCGLSGKWKTTKKASLIS
ncbi:MAG: nitrate/nitrite transporter NrtS [Campylobacteraceae bacterium]|nr:nitrate/nitrite transporter NrtS [Campylobacteraceae bacterium]